jgi:nucleoside-diphosphate-sugar epimerase
VRHVLVGGVGFVGINLAAELKGSHEVVVVARRSSMKRRPGLSNDLSKMGVDVAVLDSITPEALSKLGGDVYYHIAGKISGSYREFEEAHVGLLRQVIQAASQVSARVVYVSSTAVAAELRGVPRGSLVEEEDEHLNPKVFIHRTPYEVTKAEGERLLVSEGRRLGGRWSIVRPSLVFGPWGYEAQWKITLWAAKRGLTLRFGSRNMVYSGDLARILAMAGSGAFDGRWVYANWPFDVDISDVGQTICRMLRKGCHAVSARWAIRLAAAVPSSPFKMMYRMLSNNYKYSSRYLSDFKFTPLEEAVSKFMEWASGLTHA